MTVADELRGTFLSQHLTDEQVDWLAQRVAEERSEAGSVLCRPALVRLGRPAATEGPPARPRQPDRMGPGVAARRLLGIWGRLPVTPVT